MESAVRVEMVAHRLSVLTGRVAGAVLCAIGLVLVVALAWAIVGSLSGTRTIDTLWAAALAVWAITGVSCVVVGGRLLLHRPNEYGSSLSPTAWLMLWIFFALLVLLCGIGAASASFRHSQDVLAFVSACLIFALVSWRAYQVRRRAKGAL